jgi:hypothetical protein
MSTPGVASVETRTQAGRHASAHALPTELRTVLNNKILLSYFLFMINVLCSMLDFFVNS